MKVYIGCDHAGFEAKSEVIDILEQMQISFEDLGAHKFDETDDYPLIAQKVCDRVLDEKNVFGILICGSGAGVAMASNKKKGIRAVQGLDIYEAKMARADEDSNVLCLRAREFDHSNYYGIIKAFLETEFSKEKRHIRRIRELEDYDYENEM